MKFEVVISVTTEYGTPLGRHGLQLDPHTPSALQVVPACRARRPSVILTTVSSRFKEELCTGGCCW